MEGAQLARLVTSLATDTVDTASTNAIVWLTGFSLSLFCTSPTSDPRKGKEAFNHVTIWNLDHSTDCESNEREFKT